VEKCDWHYTLSKCVKYQKRQMRSSFKHTITGCLPLREINFKAGNHVKQKVLKRNSAKLHFYQVHIDEVPFVKVNRICSCLFLCGVLVSRTVAQKIHLYRNLLSLLE
jgi:hypothetical protein